jgi:putative Mg2+ transporter-C (MgtC) family protein
MPRELEMALRLVLAAALGASIGAQREWSGKPAGLRTLALISVGAALFAVVSALGYAGGDPTRIAAGIVTGVGFLGAGAILHRQGGVEGLTTAAAIWVSAGVGLAAGAGLYLFSVITTAIVVILLFVGHFPSRKDGPK